MIDNQVVTISRYCQFGKVIIGKCLVTKNEQMRTMIATCVANRLKFRYVLMDSWFAAKENFEFIVKKKKHFIAGLKDNRLVALTEDDRKKGRFVRVDELALTDKHTVRGAAYGLRPRSSDSPSGLYKQGWQHGSIKFGVQRFDVRWRASHYDLQETVESRRVSQIVEIQCGVGEVANAHGNDTEQSCLHVDLRRVQAGMSEHKHKLNHFALRAKLFIKAPRQAYSELQALRAA